MRKTRNSLTTFVYEDTVCDDDGSGLHDEIWISQNLQKWFYNHCSGDIICDCTLHGRDYADYLIRAWNAVFIDVACAWYAPVEVRYILGRTTEFELAPCCNASEVVVLWNWKPLNGSARWGRIFCSIWINNVGCISYVVCRRFGAVHSLASISIEAGVRNSVLSLDPGEAVRVCTEADKLYSEGEKRRGIQKEMEIGLHFASRTYA